MEFEWDENKNLANIAKHGIAFERALEIFEGRHITIPSSFAAERRHLAIGPLKHKMIAVVYTKRGEVIRLISARSARDEEKRKYRALHTE